MSAVTPLTYNSGARLILRGGTYADLSGNNTSVTNNGTTVVNDDLGRVNRSFQANGTSQNISFGDFGDDFMAGANGKFTAIFSVKELSAISSGTIFAKHQNGTGARGFFLQYVNGGFFPTLYNDGTSSSASNFINFPTVNLGALNVRRTIAFVYDNTQLLASKLKLYVDRVPISVVPAQNGTFTGLGDTTQNLVLFSRSGNAQWLNANIGFFYLNPKAMSESDIIQISSEIMSGAV